MLTPVLFLVSWTLIVWIWMYATRIPAMQRAKIDPQSAIHPGSLNVLPTAARVVADNYNHLHEQPTIFYALAVYTHLAGTSTSSAVMLAWAYVILRVAHSIAQIVIQRVAVRFALFALSTVALIALAVHNLAALAG